MIWIFMTSVSGVGEKGRSEYTLFLGGGVEIEKI